ncbi:accessory factor UbiK family protein [Marinobacterium sp. D7]|uniref:accessory factor UbiK family protein n=1 Tax=Marinobacterium ramblicola TaxID=2849041 RepID=UPI001C2DC5EB|nr:accessory factor UbiK family protein [Marinobacterium ramblicola]MBV1787796.1 accessory factor UbiK family protein [Marinobacterium ramblicola]
MRQKLIDSLNAQIGHLFEGARELPGQHELQQQIRTLVQGTFSRLDLVTRDEFDAQRAVLARTRELVEQLEKRVVELEQQGQQPVVDTDQPGSDTPTE